MPILWRPQMSLGNAVLDGDHRYLIALINTVELALRDPAARESLVTVLDQLAAYTVEHFGREERIMGGLGYAGLERHRGAHRELAQRLVEIRAAIEGAADGAPPSERDRLAELLRGWLLDHVLKEDLLLKPLLERKPDNFVG